MIINEVLHSKKREEQLHYQNHKNRFFARTIVTIVYWSQENNNKKETTIEEKKKRHFPTWKLLINHRESQCTEDLIKSFSIERNNIQCIEVVN
jgi:predicted thioredoxin/glutaredoxin